MKEERVANYTNQPPPPKKKKKEKRKKKGGNLSGSFSNRLYILEILIIQFFLIISYSFGGIKVGGFNHRFFTCYFIPTCHVIRLGSSISLPQDVQKLKKRKRKKKRMKLALYVIQCTLYFSTRSIGFGSFYSLYFARMVLIQCGKLYLGTWGPK